MSKLFLILLILGIFLANTRSDECLQKDPKKIVCELRTLVQDQSRATIGETDFAPLMSAIYKVGTTGVKERKEIKADIQKLHEDVATTEDLADVSNKVATKEGLDNLGKEVATKADLKGLTDVVATKDDLNNLRQDVAKKADLEGLRNDVATKADLNSLRQEVAMKADLEKLNNTINLVKQIVEATQALLSKKSEYKSCQEAYAAGERESKAYELSLEGVKTSVYCHMDEIPGCGSGGFTMVMKMDGNKDTFKYDSALWTDRNTYNPAAGATGLDHQETKLSTYSTASFTKVCIGMDDNGHKSFKSIDISAESLHALIAGGEYHATSLGRDAWKSLLSSGSLQQNCNREGFNAKGGHFKLRLGILGNEQNECNSDDSYVGFGTSGSPSTGNRAYHGGDKGDRETKTFGYILVQ